MSIDIELEPIEYKASSAALELDQLYLKRGDSLENVKLVTQWLLSGIVSYNPDSPDPRFLLPMRKVLIKCEMFSPEESSTEKLIDRLLELYGALCTIVDIPDFFVIRRPEVIVIYRIFCLELSKQICAESVYGY